MRPVSSAEFRIEAGVLLVSGLIPSNTKCAAITILSSTSNLPARKSKWDLIILMSFSSQIAVSARQLTNWSDETAPAGVTVDVSSELVNLLFAHQFAGGGWAGTDVGRPLVLTASQVRWACPEAIARVQMPPVISGTDIRDYKALWGLNMELKG
jgi:hypothetical protein